MNQETPAASTPSQDVHAHRIGLLDWLMLVLALLSVGLLAWETWGAMDPVWQVWVLRADYAICAVFAAEFLWRWNRAGWNSRYLRQNWYEVLGMIPVQHPAVRGFRLFRVVRILILFSRFGMAADRALGDGFTYRLVNRLQKRAVDAIKGPVTVGVLEEVAEVLAQGHYTRNIARALQENESELEAMIAEKLRDDPQTGRLSRLPFYEDVVRATTRAGFRVVLEVLRDPRTDELVADLLRENLQQIRESVAERGRSATRAARSPSS
jgi:hypothetical protein